MAKAQHVSWKENTRSRRDFGGKQQLGKRVKRQLSVKMYLSEIDYETRQLDWTTSEYFLMGGINVPEPSVRISRCLVQLTKAIVTGGKNM
jgi:hypothetical protein